MLVDPDEIMDSRCPYGYTFHAGRCMKFFIESEDCITAHEMCRYIFFDSYRKFSMARSKTNSLLIRELVN